MAKIAHSEQGFTLIEVVIAMFIITVLVATTGGIIRLTVRANTESVNTSAVTTVAQNKMEEMRNTTFSSIASHTFTDSLPGTIPHPRSAEVIVTEVRTGVKRIEVVIGYDGTTKRFVTFVSENGANS